MDHTDIVCNDDVECDRDKPDYEFRIYLAQFINWFVNRTFREVGFLIDTHRKKLFKIQVFKLYSKNEDNGIFFQLIDNFNRYMTGNATTLCTNNMSIFNMDLYPDPPQLLDRPTADFYNINGQPINTKIINLVIAAHIIHKILSESSERGPVISIRVSQLQTYMELLPCDDDEELNLGYLETLHRNPNDDTLALLRSTTPLQAEIILRAENFDSLLTGGRGDTISQALSRYPGLAIEDKRLLVSSLPHSPHPNGGSKKRNKSKIKKQKRSNKKSRRHHTRKRVSRRRNAKRFY